MLMEEALDYLERPLRRVALPDVPIPTSAEKESTEYMLDRSFDFRLFRFVTGQMRPRTSAQTAAPITLMM
jgi:hypothetical protein